MKTSAFSPATADLEELGRLEERLAQELDYLKLPATPWVTKDGNGGATDLDVAVIGGGMSGLSVAASLIFAGIDRIAIFDQAEAGREGPWATFARMETLRTPKDAPGPALGVPALTFRAWFTACFGAAAWDAMDFAPRRVWMDYLVWYRRVLALPVRNDMELLDLTVDADRPIGLTLRSRGGITKLTARRVVLATGLGGLGGPAIPSFIRGVDHRYWLHSAEEHDFSGFRGQRIGVVGAGSSAMDNAAEALENGAARVDIFVRRAEMPHIDSFAAIAGEGLKLGFAGLPDDWKWKILRYGMAAQIPPPRHSAERVLRHGNVFLHLDSPILAATEANGKLVVRTPQRVHELDRLVLATGFDIDLSRRPELTAIAGKIRTWQDMLPDVATDPFDQALLRTPYLDEGFAFQERTEGECPALRHVYCYNYQAALNHGKITTGVAGLAEASGRIVRSVSRSFLSAMRDDLYQRLLAYRTSELDGIAWRQESFP